MFPFVGYSAAKEKPFQKREGTKRKATRTHHKWALLTNIKGLSISIGGAKMMQATSFGNSAATCNAEEKNALRFTTHSASLTTSVEFPSHRWSRPFTWRRRCRSAPCNRTRTRLQNSHPKRFRARRLVLAMIDSPAASSSQCLSTQRFLTKYVDRWDFDTFKLDKLSAHRPVMALGLKLLGGEHGGWRFDGMFDRGLPLRRCLTLLEANYYDGNQYHTAIHAADVAQSMHCFLIEPKIAEWLTPLERLACIFAALGHDVCHPGLNQKFLDSSNNFLCSLYQSSVLENFHYRCLINILKESGLLENLSTSDWNKMMHLLETLILATDMQRQQHYLNLFQRFLRRSQAAVPNSNVKASSQELMQKRCRFDDADRTDALAVCTGESLTPPDVSLRPDEYRHFIFQILIKCADIGNPCRPHYISQEWSFRASTEFFSQGDEERRLGLPVTSFCDRYATTIAKIQSGFMEFVATPLFVDFHLFMDSPLTRSMVANLEYNTKWWMDALETEMQQGAVNQRRDSSTYGLSSIGDRRLVRQSTPPSTPVIDDDASDAEEDDVCAGAVAAVSEARSSLQEVAELELQTPDTLRNRRQSASALLMTPMRHSATSPALLGGDLTRRRISLPSRMANATRWTVSAALFALRGSQPEPIEDGDEEDDCDDEDGSRKPDLDMIVTGETASFPNPLAALPVSYSSSFLSQNLSSAADYNPSTRGTPAAATAAFPVRTSTMLPSALDRSGLRHHHQGGRCRPSTSAADGETSDSDCDAEADRIRTELFRKMAAGNRRRHSEPVTAATTAPPVFGRQTAPATCGAGVRSVTEETAFWTLSSRLHRMFVGGGRRLSLPVAPAKLPGSSTTGDSVDAFHRRNSLRSSKELLPIAGVS